MFFNFSQFFANQGPNYAYEEFVKREGLTLSEILKHEDTVSEVRKNNAVLLTVLKTHIPTLVLCMQETNPDLDGSANHPFVASEILSSEAILAEFGRDLELIPIAFEFLRQPHTLSSTVAGYAGQLGLRLLDRLGFRVAECVLHSDIDYVPMLMRHVEQRTVAELIVNLLSVNTLLPARQRLFSGILSLFSPEMTRKEAVNVGFIACEIVKRSVEVGEWRHIVAILMDKEIVATLNNMMMSEVAGDQIGTVMAALLSHSGIEEVIGCQSADFDLYERLKPMLETAFECLIPLSDPPVSAVPRLLGGVKLSLIQFLNSAIKLIAADLDSMVIAKKYLETVTDLFLEYPWHSELHHAYEGLIRTVVQESSQRLRIELVEKVNIVDVLQMVASAPKDVKLGRLGCMGHITRISNILLSVATTNDYIRQVLESDTWVQFATNYLIPQNRVENEEYLANSNRKESESSSAEVVNNEEDLFLEAIDDPEDEEYEFKMEPQLMNMETDFANFDFVTGGISSDSEVETAHGSDGYSSFEFWSLPLATDSLQDLD